MSGPLYPWGMGTERPVVAGKFIELPGWRKLSVRGQDAAAWLNDLVSADLSGLEPGEARGSLMLSPTGRIRAEFHVAPDPGGGFLLLQDPAQTFCGDLLAPYQLSARVALTDRTAGVVLFALPDAADPPEVPDAAWASRPTCVGGEGVDLLAPAGDREATLAALGARLERATAKDLERRRIFLGIPRLGVDAGAEDLPVEARLDAAAADSKGCYLGQEAVAKVRNLGHPRRLLLLLSSDRPVAAGDAVLSGDRPAGRVTSVAAVAGAWWAMARVGWAYREDPLRTPSGAVLS